MSQPVPDFHLETDQLLPYVDLEIPPILGALHPPRSTVSRRAREATALNSAFCAGAAAALDLLNAHLEQHGQDGRATLAISFPDGTVIPAVLPELRPDAG